MANYGTILVVDDNPAILTAVKICLAGEFDRVLTLASPDTLLPTRFLRYWHKRWWTGFCST